MLKLKLRQSDIFANVDKGCQLDQCNHRKDVTRVVSLIPVVHLELQIFSRILINDIDTTTEWAVTRRFVQK
jgi:hypothetical protein